MQLIKSLLILAWPIYIGIGAVESPLLADEAGPIQFNRDIRPILSDNCYACHGPDEGQRQAGLRLDDPDVVDANPGGREIIVAGDPEASKLVRRIHSDDQSEVMPPAEHRKKLTDEEKALLKRWVAQGAEWQSHWAWIPPVQTELPQVKNSDWPRNEVDRYILAKIEQAGVSPSKQADRITLIRRLYFDLIGLPPTREQVAQFVADESEKAYEKVVDQLLASPHFGERLAVYWLDLVRYADTVGYHGDQPVSVSPYRDYVIDAFNANMPFDQFTREQLAGDLLPAPTDEQLIASGYNRLGMMSAEGGVQPEEYLAKYAADRVRTTATVWMGVTLACAECHDHKFDPFTSKDFYSFAAFFADIKEKGLYSGAGRSGEWGPSIKVPDEELPELLDPLDRRIDELQSLLEKARPISPLSPNDFSTPSAKPLSFPSSIRAALQIDPGAWTPRQRQLVTDYFRSLGVQFPNTRRQLQRAQQRRSALVDRHTRTSLITVAVEPREMRVLPRGDWMDDSGDVVTPQIPARFGKLQDGDGRLDRMDLANWLVSPENPLTARAFVNRLWKLYFGTGLSKVLDDVGSQGEWPSHPQLLDALAIEFVQSGWNVKHMVRKLVTSQTYRQSSSPRPQLEKVDPYNRMLARQSRFRLDAELIRDNALAVSGLLVKEIGGRSVKPYQPPGLYRHLNFPKRTYEADTGDQQFRRGVYTHWQRQYLHPAMKAFDAPAREESTCERPRSNTPTAALVLLNDPSYVEAARQLAERTMRESGAGPDRQARVEWMFKTALSRGPTDRESRILVNLFESHLHHYTSAKAAAKKLIETGISEVPRDLPKSELAAWTSVARTIMNMHEFITRY